MPIVKIQGGAWRRGIKRPLIVGPPNSRKTTSLRTWPRPLHIVSFPGEKGYGSIPDEEGVYGYIFEEELLTKRSSASLLKEINDLVLNILAGKEGEIRVFFGDGLHKFYALILNDLTGGALFKGEEFDSKAYGRAHETFIHEYLTPWMMTPVEYVGFTCWDGSEKDDPNAKSKDAPSHIYPELPGKMAKRIMGEFGVVLYSEVVPSPVPGQPAKASWQTAPAGKVWGAGLKIPPAIAAKIPLKVEQDWAKLEALIVAEARKLGIAA